MGAQRHTPFLLLLLLALVLAACGNASTTDTGSSAAAGTTKEVAAAATCRAGDQLAMPVRTPGDFDPSDDVRETLELLPGDDGGFVRAWVHYDYPDPDADPYEAAWVKVARFDCTGAPLPGFGTDGQVRLDVPKGLHEIAVRAGEHGDIHVAGLGRSPLTWDIAPDGTASSPTGAVLDAKSWANGRIWLDSDGTAVATDGCRLARVSGRSESIAQLDQMCGAEPAGITSVLFTRDHRELVGGSTPSGESVVERRTTSGADATFGSAGMVTVPGGSAAELQLAIPKVQLDDGSVLVTTARTKDTGLAMVTRDGEVAWSGDLPLGRQISPGGAFRSGGSIVVVGEDVDNEGAVAWIDPKTGKITRYQVFDDVVATVGNLLVMPCGRVLWEDHTMVHVATVPGTEKTSCGTPA